MWRPRGAIHRQIRTARVDQIITFHRVWYGVEYVWCFVQVTNTVAEITQ